MRDRSGVVRALVHRSFWQFRAGRLLSVNARDVQPSTDAGVRSARDRGRCWSMPPHPRCQPGLRTSGMSLLHSSRLGARGPLPSWQSDRVSCDARCDRGVARRSRDARRWATRSDRPDYGGRTPESGPKAEPGLAAQLLILAVGSLITASFPDVAAYRDRALAERHEQSAEPAGDHITHSVIRHFVPSSQTPRRPLERLSGGAV